MAQSKVAGCDVMVLLGQPGVHEFGVYPGKEFGATIERLKQGQNLWIAPVYFAPCLFESEEDLARLQFFKPHGGEFDQAREGTKFSYVDLVQFRQTDGQPIPNSNRQHYMTALLEKLEPGLRSLRNKAGS
jgi:internalin A